MIGVPSILQTREDYDELYTLALAGEVDPSEVMCRYRGLIEDRYIYVFDKVIVNKEAADGEMPLYCICVDNEGVITQLKRASNMAAKAHSLGFTWKEVDARLVELENCNGSK